MECEKFIDRISEYIDDACSIEEKKEIEKHLLSCDTCRKEYEELKTIIYEISNLDEIDLPKEYHSNLMNKLKKEIGTKNRKKYGIYYGNLVAGLVLVLGLLSYMGLNNNRQIENRYLLNTNDEITVESFSDDSYLINDEIYGEKTAKTYDDRNIAKRNGPTEEETDTIAATYDGAGESVESYSEEEPVYFGLVCMEEEEKVNIWVYVFMYIGLILYINIYKIINKD